VGAGKPARSPLRAFHPLDREYEILLRLTFVAREAAIEVFIAVHRFVGIERLQFPFTAMVLVKHLGISALSVYY